MKIERFALERWMTRWELEVDYDICESGILPLSLKDLYALLDDDVANGLAAELESMPLGYSEARGSLGLRTILASTYDGVTAEDILVTTGAIEANFLVMNALLEPGDHVVAVAPAYQQLHSVVRAIGADLTPWPVIEGPEGFAYDMEALDDLLRPDTRMIVINAPHNPTGAVLSDAELTRILDLARAREAWVLSDEAYRWLDLPGGSALPDPARNAYDRAISVGTLSKPFGMPGLRVGWFAATPEVVAKAWSLRDYITLSPAKMSDAVARVAIEHRERVFARNREIMAANLACARDWFARHADLVSWVEPRAALLAMMSYHLPIDSETLANRLAAEAKVMLAPGSAFGMEGHLRIGIGQRPDVFASGLEAAGTFLQRVAEESTVNSRAEG